MCSIDEYGEIPLKDESVNSNKVALENDNSKSEFTEKLIKEGSVPKSSVELVKNLSEILEIGRLTSLNITINDIKGDNTGQQHLLF